MCAIIGATEGYDESTIRGLFQFSRIRGLHAFGYCFMVGDRLEVRRFIDFQEFLTDFFATLPARFIAHFRYSTSGDWQIPENNQPILRSNLALAFNGVIDMRTKPDLETAYNARLETENDGELAIISYTQSEDNLWQLLMSNRRTFAGLFMTDTGRIVALRNELRPLYHFNRTGTDYFASTSDIFARAGIRKARLMPAKQILEV